MISKIPFNVPYLTGAEGEYALDALQSRCHCGNGRYGARCIELLRERLIKRKNPARVDPHRLIKTIEIVVNSVFVSRSEPAGEEDIQPGIVL